VDIVTSRRQDIFHRTAQIAPARLENGFQTSL